MYYLRSDNKCYRAADLRLCFRICKKFSHDAVHCCFVIFFKDSCIYEGPGVSLALFIPTRDSITQRNRGRKIVSSQTVSSNPSEGKHQRSHYANTPMQYSSYFTAVNMIIFR